MSAAVNPRYACYCASKGFSSVQAMLRSERRIWPGGVMAGYVLWNREQINLFCDSLTCAEAKTMFYRGTLLENGHKAYDEWLQARNPGWKDITSDLEP